MGFDRIIALDLGKFNSVACVMDATTRRHAFAAVATTPAALHDFFVARIEAGDEPARTLVVFETCDATARVNEAVRNRAAMLQGTRPRIVG
jgi:hypothetical protein